MFKTACIFVAACAAYRVPVRKTLSAEPVTRMQKYLHDRRHQLTSNSYNYTLHDNLNIQYEGPVFVGTPL